MSSPPYGFFGRYSKVVWRRESARASNDKLYRFLAKLDYIGILDRLNKIYRHLAVMPIIFHNYSQSFLEAEMTDAK